LKIRHPHDTPIKNLFQGFDVLIIISSFWNDIPVPAFLSTELCEAKDTCNLSKLESTIEKADLLILDELSYLSFNRHQSDLLFKVISERSERASIIVTTNLEFSRWTEMFESETMVAALVDRLTFKSHLLDMNGFSYRMNNAIVND